MVGDVELDRLRVWRLFAVAAQELEALEAPPFLVEVARRAVGAGAA